MVSVYVIVGFLLDRSVIVSRALAVKSYNILALSLGWYSFLYSLFSKGTIVVTVGHLRNNGIKPNKISFLSFISILYYLLRNIIVKVDIYSCWNISTDRNISYEPCNLIGYYENMARESYEKGWKFHLFLRPTRTFLKYSSNCESVDSNILSYLDSNILS